MLIANPCNPNRSPFKSRDPRVSGSHSKILVPPYFVARKNAKEPRNIKAKTAGMSTMN